LLLITSISKGKVRDHSLKIGVAITGASGSIYAKVLLDRLNAFRDDIAEVAVVMSNNAKDVWRHELGNTSYDNYPFRYFTKDDFNSPLASGSANYGALIIIPCSMGTMGRIASGISNDLVTRASDVMLKERRKLILVAREFPLNLIQINNMKAITEAGGIICPASPSFYSKPATVEQLVSTVTDRVLELCGLDSKSFRWGSEKK
jgi:4-hydroxy-3-polyprenylbenzoate decarboxylase